MGEREIEVRDNPAVFLEDICEFHHAFLSWFCFVALAFPRAHSLTVWASFCFFFLRVVL